MKKAKLDDLRMELSLKAKNGIDFILAAAMIWFVNSYLWTLPYSDYNKSIFIFIAGGMMLPLAFGISKIFKTTWKIKNNPLQPLGLWLNFAQLFYFPFLIFVLVTTPKYFIMTYAIITGAHFFPYTWFYNEQAYAILAGVISIGAFLIGINAPPEYMFYVALFVGLTLLAMFLKLTLKSK